MSFFDIFDKNRGNRANREFGLDANVSKSVGGTAIAVFHPKAYNEVESIIDALKEGKNAMVHLNALKKETADRIIDILSGAIYALGGGMYEIEPNSDIYMFSPNGVIVNG